MRHSPGFYKRLAANLLAHDLTRAAISLIAMGIFALVDLPLAMILILPILIYAGLWLATSTTERPRLPGDRRADYQSCLELKRAISTLSAQVRDESVANQLRGILNQIDNILGAVVEDEKYDAAGALRSFLELTKDLLAKYLKVVRRGLDGAETHEDVRDNLATLSGSYQEFWERLNRDVVVDLEALSETIRDLLQRLAEPEREPELPVELLEKELDALERLSAGTEQPLAAGALTNGQGKMVRLTPRQMEVLCLLTQAKTDRQISGELFISPRTVEKHVADILEVLGVDTRMAAALWAVRNGLCHEHEAT